ncbi:MAG: thrombospondin type 3 repeat-containing protein, partial [Nitrosarchaeum sp.]
MLIATLTSVSVSPAFASHDLDRDGVPDENDHCPNLQEDYQGIIDGCPSNFVPWYDEDFDGIPDNLDLCPSLRENYNKFQDEDGCPDTPPGSK